MLTTMPITMAAICGWFGQIALAPPKNHVPSPAANPIKVAATELVVEVFNEISHSSIQVCASSLSPGPSNLTCRNTISPGNRVSRILVAPTCQCRDKTPAGLPGETAFPLRLAACSHPYPICCALIMRKRQTPSGIARCLELRPVHRGSIRGPSKRHQNKDPEGSSPILSRIRTGDNIRDALAPPLPTCHAPSIPPVHAAPKLILCPGVETSGPPPSVLATRHEGRLDRSR